MPYICEISQTEAYKIVKEDRDFGKLTWYDIEKKYWMLIKSMHQHICKEKRLSFTCRLFEIIINGTLSQNYC